MTTKLICALVVMAIATVSAYGGAILREVYTGLSGGTIADLTNHWSYPNSPAATNWLTDAFEAPVNYADNYGQRLRGYLVPPETGYYVFWTASDDYSELWLSTNAVPATNYVRIAWVYGWTNPREWGKYGSQQSDPVYLEAGRLYAVYVLMADGAYGDNLSVRWQRPNGQIEEPIPCTYLLPPGGPFASPQIVAQSATNVTATEGDTVEFWVSVSNMYPVAHQWQRNGTNMPGATASNVVVSPISLSDNGSAFRCVLSNSLGVVTSAPCYVSVLADTNAPMLVGAYNVGTVQVVAVFNEPMDIATSETAANYKLNGGVLVSNAALSSDGQSVVLTVSPLTLGNYYTLSVSNVRDRATAPNTIGPGAYWNFRAQPFSPVAIGGATQVAPAVVYSSNGVTVSAAGTGFGEETDAGYFLYQLQSGNFDVCVRVEGIVAEDMWARGGIMARESLSAESDFAAVFATPSLAGLFFEYRGTGSNLLNNASFELGQYPGVNPTNWNGDWYTAHALTNNTPLGAGKRAPAQARSGTWMLMLTNNVNTSGDNWHGTAQWFTCAPGQPYLFSAYYLFQSNLPNDHYAFIKFDWYDSGYNWIGQLEGERLSSHQATWTYNAVTSVAPANAVYGKAVFVYEDKDGRVNAPGESFNAFWDDAVLKRAGGRQSVRGPSRPINPPMTWLRLKRAGNVFTGFYSYDGSRWTVLGAVTNALPSSLYLGLAVSSWNRDEAATVYFCDWGNVSGGTTGRQQVTRYEGLGPSSRRTGVIVSEIMYHPEDREDSLDLEFIELFNTEPFDLDLSGWRISGSVSYTFPSGTVLKAGAFAVIANRPADVEAVYGLSGVHGPYTGGKLPNDSGTVRLRNARDAVLLEVEYRDRDPWPWAADGLGHSLVLARPSYGENDPRAWGASAYKGGSPGRAEPVADTRPGVVMNEILTHTDLPQVDFVELYNYSLRTVDVSRFVIRATTNEYVIPTNTVLAPRQFLAITETQMGFTLEKEGGLFALEDGSRTQVVDIVRLGAQENGVSWGRYRDGQAGWYPLNSPTPGTNNSAIRVSDVVINEIMYHPITDSSDDEYIELYNRGTSAVSLAHWRLTDGVSYTFPTNAAIPAGGYVVIAKNVTNLLAKYAQLNTTNTMGPYSGSLSDRGERIALERPEDPLVPDRAFVIVNEVSYADGDEWGRWTDGDGSSLELRDPHSNNRLAANWAGSDESAKGAWTNLSVTGVLDNGNNPASSLQMVMLGEGECVLDDVEAIRTSVNRVTNSTFNATMNGWLAEGDHVETSWTTNGFGGTGGLHVRAEDEGDNIVNNVRTVLSSPFSSGDTVTLSAKARWVAGHPGLLIRLSGNWLELSASLPVPSNLGTPGLPNSCYTSNVGPAIGDVRHDPTLPTSGEQVMVTARVHDPDGIGSVTLLYRLDPSSTTNTLTMRDDGSSGDAVANDGIYSVTLPSYAAGTTVAFRVRAVDAASPPRTNIWPNSAIHAEALIRYGDPEPAGALGTYRFWFSRSAYTNWVGAPKLGNKYQPGTFVSGDRVIYNAGAHYRGSPFVRPSYDNPTGNVCAYRIRLPKDQRFLGVDSLNLDTLEPWRDNTYQRERGIFWIAEQMGLPVIARRYVRLYFNGSQRGEIYGDVHHVNSDYIETWFPDDADGAWFKIDDWFEFTNTDYIISDSNYRKDHKDATLEKFTTTGGALKKARYRWNWEKKGSGDDYSEFFALVEAANISSTTQYVQAMQAVADIENWAAVFALRHVACDWDGYGYARGKNGYVYKAPRLRWHMLLWDFDFGLGSADSHPYDTPLFNEIHDPVISNRFLQTAPFRRAFLQAAKAMVAGPMQSSQIGPFLDAGYQALRANGLNIYPPNSVNYWTGQRRYYLMNELARYEAPFEITSNGGAPFSTNRNYITLTGKAPLDVVGLSINGINYTPQWSTVSNWYVSVALQNGTNTLVVTGYDRNGNVVDSASDTIQINYTGTNISPVGWLAINEIQYNPTNTGAGFVEIYNRSTTHAFDLYNYRLQGVDVTFTTAVVVAPGGFAVVVADPVVFAQTYGPMPVAAQYEGALDNGGEWLQLIRLDGTNEPLVVCEVRYDDDPPWPTNADGFGPSLQLIDAAEDVWRVGNWAVASGTNALYTPGATNNVVRDLLSFPKIWLNELQVTNVSGVRDNANDREPWVELYSQESTSRALTNFYLTDQYTNLFRWRFPTGSYLAASEFRVVWLDNETNETAGTNYHASFRPAVTGSLALVWSNTSGGVIVDYINYTTIPADRSYGSYPDGIWTNRVLFLYPTPGGTNNNAGAPVTVRINEWMADNASFMTDPYGEYDDWIELYNFGTNDVNLSGFYLTDNLTQPSKWAFPAGTVITAGGFLVVWADNGYPTQTNGLHTSWALSKSGEAIGLYTSNGWVVDSLVFGTQTTDRTEGRWPDGESTIYPLAVPTPWAPNIVSTNNSPPVISPVDPQAVDEGQGLAFQVVAVDTDTPPQRLVYEIVAGAPGGATLNGTNGWFAWTPQEADGPGTNEVFIRVSDNGWPQKSATVSVLIAVTEVNTAPGLAAIPEIRLNPGSLLRLTVTGVDTDIPPNNVTFSLLPSAPSGASMTADGLFEWEPAAAQAASTNLIAVKVQDDGVPALASTGTLVIVVTGLDEQFLAGTDTGMGPLGFHIRWNAESGASYQVQCSSGLLPAAWSNLGSSVVATGSVATKVDETAPSVSQRFYRILRWLP